MQGRCLCGAVTVDSPASREIGACHCGFCRRWSGGGPLLAVHCGPDVRFGGSDRITVYASSDWAQRAFCGRCGTHLYYRLNATGEYFVSVGLFDGDDFEIVNQIYIDRKPAYYALANRTPVMTEQEVIERFSNPGGSIDG